MSAINAKAISDDRQIGILEYGITPPPRQKWPGIVLLLLLVGGYLILPPLAFLILIQP